MTNRRIFIDNLSPTTTQETLATLFKASGTVESVDIPGGQKPAHSSSHAFIVMSTAQEATAAIRTLNRTQWHGLRLTVTHAGDQTKQNAGFSGGITVSERKNRI